ncbi:hypothetical protein V2I01_33400 [Micromonospora sp. BRA006-A]|nr:hypothetical protein [Micromonospora sp. BRA006-A]
MGAHRWRRRHLRRGHPLLVPLAGDAGRAGHAAAETAGLAAPGDGGVAVGRRRRGGIRPAADQLHRLARGAADADLHAGLSLLHRATGEIRLDVQTSGDDPRAVAFVDDYVAAIGAGVGAEPAVQAFTWPWLRATTSSYPGLSRYRMKSKSAMLRRPWTEGQIATIHRFLSAGARSSTAPGRT